MLKLHQIRGKGKEVISSIIISKQMAGKGRSPRVGR
jgi:hypothetical protein